MLPNIARTEQNERNKDRRLLEISRIFGEEIYSRDVRVTANIAKIDL